MTNARFANSLAAGMLLVAACATTAPPSKQPNTITEIVAAQSGSAPDIFVLDAPQHLLFRGLIFGGWLREPAPRLETLTTFDADSQLVDLAYDGTHAFVLDAHGPRVLMIRASGRADVVFAGAPLREVSHLAVSQDGWVAVSFRLADRDALAFLRVGHGASAPEVVTNLPFSRIDQMRFAGGDLHVLSNNILYSTTFESGSHRAIADASSTVKWRTQSVPGIHDNFDVADAVFYFVGKPNVALLHDTSIFVPVAIPGNIVPHRLTATGGELLIATADGGILQVAKPAPVTIEVSGPASDVNAAVIGVSSYLSRQNLLPVENITASREFGSMIDVLVASGVLASGDLDPGSRLQLRNILCTLSECQNQVDPLTARIAVGQALRVPNLTLTSVVSVDKTNLSGRSVAEVIAERFPSQAERVDLTEEYLRRVNKDTRGFGGWQTNTGWVRLPKKTWHFSVFVPEKDIDNSKSELGALKRQMGISVTRVKEASVTTQSCQVPMPAVSAVDLSKRQDVVRQLMHATDLPDGGARLQPIVIAEKDVDKTHPAFFAGDVSAWQRKKSAFAFEPEANVCDSALPVVREPNLTYKDHGTHVAGVIASRGTQGVKGLLPAVRLYWLSLDVPNQQDILDGVKEAVALDLHLFNFSSDVGFDDDIGNKFDQLVALNRSSALFVIAAGNTGGAPSKTSLANILSPAPNVIVVGAGNDCSDVLGDVVDGFVHRRGSSRGPKVTLLAPGLRIPGPVASDALAQDSGSSQATSVVTGAAAMLMASNVEDPSNIKTRLVYTSDWLSEYDGAISPNGGFLNIERAVWRPNDTLVWMSSASNTPRSLQIDFTNSPVLRLTPSGSRRVSDEIPLRRVLRIQQIAESEYRVMWASAPGDPAGPDQLITRVNVAVELSFNPPCTSTVWNATTHAFEPDDSDLCKRGFQLSEVDDFVAPVPKFEVVTK